MKIIELLNKIADGEKVPKKIKFQNLIYEYQEDTQDYFNGKTSEYITEGFSTEDNRQFLNIEIEVIEEPKELPDKIDEIENINIAEEQIPKKEIISKVNKIIDYLKDKEVKQYGFMD